MPETDNHKSWIVRTLGRYDSLIWGILMLGGTLWLYSIFTDMESSDNVSTRLPSFVLALYDIGGKNLTCAVCLLLSMTLIAIGVRKELLKE